MLISSVLISNSVCAWSDSYVQYCFVTMHFSVYLEEIIGCSSEEYYLFVQIISLACFCTVYGKIFFTCCIWVIFLLRAKMHPWQSRCTSGYT